MKHEAPAAGVAGASVAQLNPRKSLNQATSEVL